MTNATLSLARGLWREQLNQRKVTLSLVTAQVGIAALLLWRMKPSPAPLLLSVVTVATVSLLGALVTGLILGREQLYGRSALRTLHVSPAPGSSLILALLLAGLPQRLFSSLVIASVTGWLLAAGWAIPLLWLLACLSSLAGYAGALVALIGWVRVHPRSLAVLWGIAVGLGVSIVVTLLGLVTLGLPAAPLAALIQAKSWWGVGGGIGLVGLPLLYPGQPGEWYREAYLRMQELGDSRHRVRASRWPRVLPGAAGALQARLWREVWLNWFTWVRLALMLLLLGLLAWRPGPFIALAARLPVPVLLGLGLLSVIGSFGELQATLGGSDGPLIGLSLVAGVPAARVVAGKWVAALPWAVLSSVCTGLFSVVLKQPSPTLALAAGCVGLGFGVIALAGGLFDLNPLAEIALQEVPEVLRAALEQLPRRLGGVIGYVSGVVFTVAAVWLCQRWPAAALPVALAAAAVAHLALIPGYRYLKRLGR